MATHITPRGLGEVREHLGLAMLVGLAQETAPTAIIPAQRHRRRRARPKFWAALCVVLTIVVVPALIVQLDVLNNPAGASGPKMAAKPYRWPAGVPPIGITLSGLQAYVITPQVITTMEHQALVAQRFWYANTIRYQVMQDELVGVNGDKFNAKYMADIRTLTNYTLSLGLTVVLNAQTEQATGYGADESLPTHATRVFWEHIMAYYKDNPHVVFDLFNEPRRCTWPQWRVSFQRLVSYIRRQGASNQIWVEGLWWGSTLRGMSLLRGGNIVYSFHKPGGPWPYKTHANRRVWRQAFGFWARRGVPVVNGEFGNYRGSFYWHHHPVKTVRRYLSFLAENHIGMLAWSLLPGSLNSTLKYTSVSHEPQGDGALVRAWFRIMGQRAAGEGTPAMRHLS